MDPKKLAARVACRQLAAITATATAVLMLLKLHLWLVGLVQ